MKASSTFFMETGQERLRPCITLPLCSMKRTCAYFSNIQIQTRTWRGSPTTQICCDMGTCFICYRDHLSIAVNFKGKTHCNTVEHMNDRETIRKALYTVTKYAMYTLIYSTMPLYVVKPFVTHECFFDLHLRQDVPRINSANMCENVRTCANHVS